MRRICLSLLIVLALAATAWCGSQLEAKVVTVAREPTTGRFILILKFDPDDWYRLKVKPRPGQIIRLDDDCLQRR